MRLRQAIEERQGAVVLVHLDHRHAVVVGGAEILRLRLDGLLERREGRNGRRARRLRLAGRLPARNRERGECNSQKHVLHR